MADKTERELREDIRKPLLKAAEAFDYFGSVVEEPEWFYHNADALRDLAEVVDPSSHHWSDNVVPLRSVAKADPLPPDRPRCRG